MRFWDIIRDDIGLVIIYMQAHSRKKNKTSYFCIKKPRCYNVFIGGIVSRFILCTRKKKDTLWLYFFLPHPPTARPALEGKIIIAEKGRGRGSYILLSLHQGSEKHSKGWCLHFIGRSRKDWGFFLGKPCVGSWHVSLSRAYSCGV